MCDSQKLSPARNREDLLLRALMEAGPKGLTGREVNRLCGGRGTAAARDALLRRGLITTAKQAGTGGRAFVHTYALGYGPHPT